MRLMRIGLVICALSLGIGLIPLIPAAAQTDDLPRFEPVECPSAIPARVKAECGYLIVPEDRADPDSPTLWLYVTILKSWSDTPAPDPVIYLEGGPGGSMYPPAWYDFPVLETRDLILFDQRGTGVSEPSLDCPELDQQIRDTLDQDINSDASIELLVDAALTCRDRLAADGIDLTDYNSANNAADVADLRVALGVDEWNIYGISYGTRLALTVMRDHPAGVRSVVLDSTYPPAADLVAELVPNGRRALNKLFEGCASNATCSEFAPDLETMFWDTVAQLDAEPALVSVAHPYRGDSYDFLLDGYALIEMTFNSLYNAADIAHLPYLIWSASRGKYYIVAKQAIQYRVLGEFISDGMYYSVECNEEYPFFTPGPEPDPDDPLADIDAITADVCAEWQAVTPDPVENEPVVSDIPTLVLAGEYDPITPPAWGQLAAETLSSSYFFEYPGLAHGVTRDHFCPLGMMLTFLDDPATAPDASCIEEMDGPAFVRY